MDEPEKLNWTVIRAIQVILPPELYRVACDFSVIDDVYTDIEHPFYSVLAVEELKREAEGVYMQPATRERLHRLIRVLNDADGNGYAFVRFVKQVEA